ncbi:hypothetical protein [Micromonospora echinospora]|uniref:hypothetical protein n=1 Tax=Micromonospora echinospora TaxID=1877 RepID=UPI00366BBAEA
MTAEIDRVKPALTPLHALYKEMEADLNDARGGFGWWYGHFDQASVMFATDYLLQTVEQIADTLGEAAQHEREFNEAWYGQTTRLRQDPGNAAYVRHLNSVSVRKYALRIDKALAGFFGACGSSLDFLAACTIGVLGLRADLVTASWSTIATAKSGNEKVRRRILATEDTAGRKLQDDAVSDIYHTLHGEPDGWLTWTLDMRNMMIHRPRRIHPHMIYRRHRRDELQLAMQLPRNPQLTDAEALVISDRDTDLYLWEHAGTTLDGVLSNLIQATSKIANILQSAWLARRNEPTLLKQPKEQWQKVYPERRDLSHFSGFGGDTLPPTDQKVTATPGLMDRRLRAARLTDEDRSYWVKNLLTRDE